MAKWTDTLSKIGEVVVGLTSAITMGYSSVVVAQAERGYFDSITSMNNLQIDNAINSANEQKKVQELNKQLTAINGKIRNGIQLTEDEYNFMVSNGFIMNEYKLNNDGTATKIENENSNDLKLTGLSAKGYITLGAIILGTIFLIKKVF